MKRLSLIYSLLLFSHIFLLPYNVAAQQNVEGEWIGGLDSGKDWLPITVRFQTGAQDIKATLDVPRLGLMNQPLNQIKIDSTRVHFEWVRQVGTGVFDGEFKDGGIVGSYQRGEVRSRFVLVRVAKVEPQTLERVEGSYRIGRNRFGDIGLLGDGRLYFVDSGTRRIAALNPSSETAFFAGESADIPFPIGVRVTFDMNSRGEVGGLTWSESGSRAVKAKKVNPYRKETIAFRNGDATLTGELLLPATKKRHPAIILAGQGYYLSNKSLGFYRYFFLRQGLAVLTLGERKVNGKNVDYTRTSFEERARDLLAGVAALKTRADLNPKRIGLYGDSQTAWITPLAATLSTDVAFLIHRVSSALPQQENVFFEIENDMRRNGLSENDIAQAKTLRRQFNNAILTNTGWEALKTEIEKSKNESWFGYARLGWFSSVKTPPDDATLKEFRGTFIYDPVPVLERVTVPVLAMNGELDENVPTKSSVPMMEQALRKAGNKDFTVIVFPKAGHNFMETDTPYGSQFARRVRYVPDFWDTMATWLRKQLNMRD